MIVLDIQKKTLVNIKASAHTSLSDKKTTFRSHNSSFMLKSSVLLICYKKGVIGLQDLMYTE